MLKNCQNITKVIAYENTYKTVSYTPIKCR